MSTPTSGHIIAVVGGKGGVGKSVFSANFALAMALDAKNNPAIVDADPNGTGDLGFILGAKQGLSPGDQILEGKISDPVAVRGQFLNYKIPNSPTSLFAMQLSSNPERLHTMDPGKIELAIKQIKKCFPVTIVDCGSQIDGAVMKILDASSLILVVSNPEVLVLNQTKKIVDKLQNQLFGPELVKVVLNKWTANSPYQPQLIEQTLKRQVLVTVPDEPSVAQGSLAKGLPVLLGAPQSGISKSLVALSRLLIEKKVLERAVLVNRPKTAPLAAVPNGSPVASGAPSGEKKVGKEPTDPRSIFKIRVQSILIEKMELKNEQLALSLSPEKSAEIRNKATKIVSEILASEDHSWKGKEESSKLMKEILDEALGLGPLEDFLSDPSVSEIMVNRADRIYIEKGGKLQLSPITFSSNGHLKRVIERIVLPMGRRIDESSPYVDARLMDGSRVHAIIPPLAIDGPMLTIRKFPSKRLGVADVIKFGSMSQEMADFLRSCVEARMNVIISGGTGSGKTSLLNILSSFIQADHRILTVEDAAELQLQQEHVGRLETKPANIEGKGAVTIRDLVKQTLRMRPERIIIGEVRGGEALDMLQAMNTGHDGSMATVHANSPREAMSRLETLVMMAGMELPVKAIREQLSTAVNVIVQQSRLSDGSRKITHITEVSGMQADVITLSDIFVFKQTGIDANRKVVGKHVATGFIPRFIEKIEALGIKVPRGLFKAA